MNTRQIEAWVLSVVDAQTSGRPVEDSRVELKAEWPDPVRAARRLAGHANAALGEPVLWIVGLDQKRGLVGASERDFASWWSQVSACFDEIAPSVTELNVPASGTTVVGLLINTERAPYVVRNPAFGQAGGGAVELEVPWRSGTSVRSATRADLIRLLSPLEGTPQIELHKLTVSSRAAQPGDEFIADAAVTLYVVPATSEPVVFPFHRCSARLTTERETAVFRSFRMFPPTGFSGRGAHSLSKTVESGSPETLVHGPGQCLARCDGARISPESQAALEVQFEMRLQTARGQRPLVLTAKATRVDQAPEGSVSWQFEAPCSRE